MLLNNTIRCEELERVESYAIKSEIANFLSSQSANLPSHEYIEMYLKET